MKPLSSKIMNNNNNLPSPGSLIESIDNFNNLCYNYFVNYMKSSYDSQGRSEPTLSEHLKVHGFDCCLDVVG